MPLLLCIGKNIPVVSIIKKPSWSNSTVDQTTVYQIVECICPPSDTVVSSKVLPF